MDYTDASRIKAMMDANSSASDALLATIATAASRAIDRYCAGAQNSDNYFALATISDEIQLGRGLLSAPEGLIKVWPHKPIVSAVTAFAWKLPAETSWISETPVLLGNNLVGARFGTSYQIRTLDVKISYTGGYGAAITTLPADLVDAATLLGVRYYKEAQSGLSDSIGVAELGTLVYTKAWPVRVREMLQPYKRIVPW